MALNGADRTKQTGEEDRMTYKEQGNQRLTNRKIGEAEKCHQKTRESSQFERF